jgi:hypothetical protein
MKKNFLKIGDEIGTGGGTEGETGEECTDNFTINPSFCSQTQDQISNPENRLIFS